MADPKKQMPPTKILRAEKTMTSQGHILEEKTIEIIAETSSRAYTIYKELEKEVFK